MGMGLSGLAFVGSDIGGFAEVPSAELYTRWLQTGVFYPFMRTHTDVRHARPGALVVRHLPRSAESPRHRAALRAAAAHLQRHARSQPDRPARHAAAAAGVPRRSAIPTAWTTSSCSARTCWSRRFCARGPPNVRCICPKGQWFDYWTGQRHEGGTRIRMPVTLASIPIFVRAGAVLFSQPVVQHTGEMPGQPLRIRVFPGPATRRHALRRRRRNVGIHEGTIVASAREVRCRRSRAHRRDRRAVRVVSAGAA